MGAITASVTRAILSSTARSVGFYFGGVPFERHVADFTTGLPTNYTYTRADTVASVVNSSGNLVWGTSNGIRIQHTSAGVPLGALVEYSRTNRFTNYSAVPTAVADFSVTSTATINVTTDTTAITAAKLQAIVTGNVFVATGGVSGGTVTLPGTTGSTSNCSFSMYARVSVGTSATLTHTGTSAGTTVFTNTSAYQRVLLENQTISATTVQMQITIPANTTVLFILPQIEVGSFASTPIKTLGAAATRAADVIADTSFSSRSYFNLAEGTILFEGTPFQDVNMGDTGTLNYQFFVGKSDNSDALGISAGGAQHQYSPLVIAPGQAGFSGTFETSPIANQPTFSGVSWTNGSTALAWADGFAHKTGSFGTMDITNYGRLSVGHRFSGAGTQFFQGIVRRITVLNKAVSMIQAASYYEVRPRKFIMAGGQSNMLRNFTNAAPTGNSGHKNFITQMNTYYTSSDNFFVNGCWDGSRVLANGVYTCNTSGCWWYDASNGNFGPAMDKFTERAAAMIALGAECIAVAWDQGEGDVGRTTAEKKAGNLAVYNRMRSFLGNVPVFIRDLGRREDGTASDAFYQLVRNAHSELITEYDWIYDAPDKINEPLTDAVVHLTQAGYAHSATPFARKILKQVGNAVTGPVNAPYVTSATFTTSTELTIDIAYDSTANDFTGTEGFKFLDNGTEIRGTFSKVSPTRIKYTLESVPVGAAGTQVLYYGYGAVYGEKTYTVAAADVNAAADTITITGHAFLTGDQFGGSLISGTFPGGLTQNAIYYVNKVDANTIKLYDTSANAIVGGATGLINITSAGSGTFRMSRITDYTDLIQDNSVYQLSLQAEKMVIPYSNIVPAPDFLAADWSAADWKTTA